MKNFVGFLSAALILALPATAQDFANPIVIERYEECLRVLETDPGRALLDARDWFIQDRSAPARHCEALSLVELGDYSEAALLLDNLATNMPPSFNGLRTAIFAQAGNAWLLAGNPEGAVLNFGRAIALDPEDVDAWIDRARAQAELDDFEAAQFDLNEALRLDPWNADAYAFRANARRVLRYFDAALEDVAAALSINPNHATAIFERASLRAIRGDTDGARADWLTVITIAPASTIASLAEQRLFELDGDAPAP